MTIAPEGTTLHSLYFKSADTLIRALGNGLLFAGADMTRPTLAAVKFEFDGERLETLSTDRYRACIEPVELAPGMDQTGQPAFEFLLPRDAAKAALAFLKGNRRDPIQLTYDTTSGAVRLSALCWSAGTLTAISSGGCRTVGGRGATARRRLPPGSVRSTRATTPGISVWTCPTSRTERPRTGPRLTRGCR